MHLSRFAILRATFGDLTRPRRSQIDGARRHHDHPMDHPWPCAQVVLKFGRDFGEQSFHVKLGLAVLKGVGWLGKGAARVWVGVAGGGASAINIAAGKKSEGSNANSECRHSSSPPSDICPSIQGPPCFGGPKRSGLNTLMLRPPVHVQATDGSSGGGWRGGLVGGGRVATKRHTAARANPPVPRPMAP